MRVQHVAFCYHRLCYSCYKRPAVGSVDATNSLRASMSNYREKLWINTTKRWCCRLQLLLYTSFVTLNTVSLGTIQILYTMSYRKHPHNLFITTVAFLRKYCTYPLQKSLAHRKCVTTHHHHHIFVYSVVVTRNSSHRDKKITQSLKRSINSKSIIVN